MELPTLQFKLNRSTGEPCSPSSRHSATHPRISPADTVLFTCPLGVDDYLSHTEWGMRRWCLESVTEGVLEGYRRVSVGNRRCQLDCRGVGGDDGGKLPCVLLLQAGDAGRAVGDVKREVLEARHARDKGSQVEESKAIPTVWYDAMNASTG